MSGAIQTVRRRTKRYRRVLETAYDCRAYTLGNYFIGEPCNALALVQYMRDGSPLGFCRLTTRRDGLYTLHVHSNCWFEFRAEL